MEWRRHRLVWQDLLYASQVSRSEQRSRHDAETPLGIHVDDALQLHGFEAAAGDMNVTRSFDIIEHAGANA